MMTKQQGFTLIELVAVIVILGALAVVALPRFIDLQSEADQAATEGVAGAISAAYATNYAASLVKDSSQSWGDPVSSDEYAVIDANTDMETPGDIDASLMTGTPISDGNYTIDNCASGDTGFSDPGDSHECELHSQDGATANFTAIATS